MKALRWFAHMPTLFVYVVILSCLLVLVSYANSVLILHCIVGSMLTCALQGYHFISILLELVINVSSVACTMPCEVGNMQLDFVSLMMFEQYIENIAMYYNQFWHFSSAEVYFHGSVLGFSSNF